MKEIQDQRNQEKYISYWSKQLSVEGLKLDRIRVLTTTKNLQRHRAY